MLTIAVSLSLTCPESFAQINQSYTLNKTVPLAPEAAKFANYYYTPPISSTGTVPIEIPIYEIDVDGVKVPISLTYQTSGIPVMQLSGSVGLGWSLNVGGGIYRSINGRPDEYTGGSSSTFLNPSYSPKDFLASKFDATTLENQSIVNSFVSNGMDVNQDNYSYNFLGQTGGLFFDGNLQMKNLNYRDLDFSYDSKSLNYFIAKDVKGNSFRFNVKEFSTRSQSGLGVTGVTAWKLDEITTVHNQKINFSYIDYNTSYSYPSASTIYGIKGLEVESSGSCFSDKLSVNTIYAISSSANKLISSVSSQNLIINFYYLDETNASNWKKKLDRIEVKNMQGEVVKRVRFEYTLFAGDPRLKLSKLVFEATTEQEKSDYSFTYYEERSLPPINTLSKDAFGYYNGYNNTTLLKLAQLQDVAEGNWNANRQVNEIYVTAGSLKQVVYPTSGGLTLYYSANKFGTNYAPGIRVNKLEFFDGEGIIVGTKYYEYDMPEGLWMSFPDYAIREIPVSGELFGADRSFSYSSENTGKLKHLPANFFYKKVTIKEIDNGKESATVEYYDDPIPYATNEPLEEYVFQPVLTKRESYVGNAVSGTKIRTETFNYTPVVSSTDMANMYKPIASYLANIELTRNGSPILYPCYNFQPGFIVKNTLRAKWLKLESEVLQTYPIAEGATPTILTTSYHYENPNHRFPTRILRANSLGKNISNEIKYPQDMIASGEDPTGVYQQMVSKNMLNNQIVFTEKIGGDSIKSQINEYVKTTFGFPVLSSVKSLDVKTKQFENRIEYRTHDSYGNVLDQKATNGPTMSFIYGYGGQYPIAKIENATYTEIQGILTATEINNLNAVSVSEEIIRNTVAKLRNHANMRKAQVSAYTYKPLVGMTSMTNPLGMTEFYQYDGFQRLKDVLDFDSNVILDYRYNYKP